MPHSACGRGDDAAVTRTKRPECARKTSYRSADQAKRAISYIRVHGEEREKRPIRAYRCPFCDRFHLTSQHGD